MRRITSDSSTGAASRGVVEAITVRLGSLAAESLFQSPAPLAPIGSNAPCCRRSPTPRPRQGTPGWAFPWFRVADSEPDGPIAVALERPAWNEIVAEAERQGSSPTRCCSTPRSSSARRAMPASSPTGSSKTWTAVVRLRLGARLLSFSPPPGSADERPPVLIQRPEGGLQGVAAAVVEAWTELSVRPSRAAISAGDSPTTWRKSTRPAALRQQLECPPQVVGPLAAKPAAFVFLEPDLLTGIGRLGPQLVQRRVTRDPPEPGGEEEPHAARTV